MLSSLKTATTSLAKGNYVTFARNALKHPQLKGSIVTAVAAEVRRECQIMCSDTDGQTSVLKRTSANELKRFNWSDVMSELNKQAPVFTTILEASVKRFRKQHPKKTTERSVAFAASILLRERNKFMCTAQCVNSLLLHAGHASKMVCCMSQYVIIVKVNSLTMTVANYSVCIISRKCRYILDSEALASAFHIEPLLML